MMGALRDCVRPMMCVRHLASPQLLLESFDKEIYAQLKEVITDLNLIIMYIWF